MITWKKEIDAKKIGAEITAIVFFIKINLIPRLGLLVSMVSRQTEHGEQNMSGVESQWYNLDKHEIQAKEIDNKES